MSYALRHLGIAEHTAGRLDASRDRLEESVRLRREIGFLSGGAANLVGLTYVAAGQGRRDEALKLIEEARAIAEATGARGIMRSIEDARDSLGNRRPHRGRDVQRTLIDNKQCAKGPYGSWVPLSPVPRQIRRGGP